MKKILFPIFLLIFILIYEVSLLGQGELKKIRQWNLGDREIYSKIFNSLIDKDGHVVSRLGKQNISVLITPKDAVFFAPMGQGPSDLYMACAPCFYHDDLAWSEFSQRVKIFTKKNNQYFWKKTIWFKRTGASQHISSIIFYKEKWFITGSYILTTFQENKPQTISLLRVLDSEGKPLKELLISEVMATFKYNLMNYYVVAHEDHVFFVAEDELKIHEISVDELTVKKEINLETPAFYKKMPKDFYVHKKSYMGDLNLLVRDIEYWKIAYSAIHKVIIADGYLILHTLPCDEKLKKYALLFYDLENFKLQKIFYSNDYFLGSRNGKYYFYANGNPGLDEEANECIINIYAFEKQKDIK